MKILVVEDNEDSRNLLVKVLRAYGHEAMATANGAEALEQALVQPPDIVVSDILMPKMDGYRLCYEWQQNDKLKDIPLVFYTATYTTEEDEKFALSLGATTFVRKPTEPDALIQILSEVFEKAKSGTLAPPKVAPLEPSLFLAEYNKRIVAKLDKKVTQLEAEITERKQAEHDLNERVKELSCLYGIAGIAERPGITLDELYQEVVNLLPAGWQYPEITCVRIIIDDKEFKTENYRETKWKQSSDIKMHEAEAGVVEVGYLEERPELDEGPFLKEEGLLLNAVAERLGRITERKQAEEEIKRVAQEWRTTFDSISDLVFICDKNFRLLRANKACADTFKRKPTELIGKLCYELVHGTKKPVPNCPHEKTIKTKKQATAEFFEPHLGMHLEISTSPIFNGNGEVVAFVHLMRDITERKQAEEMLRESEDKYRAIFETTGTATVIIDEDTISLANTEFEKLSGYSKEEIEGKKSWTEFVAKDDLERTKECHRLRRIDPDTAPKQYEFRFIDREGNVKDILVAVDVISGTKKSVASLLDITERKQAEEKARQLETLKELDRMRAQLLSNISHELRTPLTSIKGFASTLLRTDVKWSEEEQQDFLQTIDQEADRLTRLISDLLDMSRLEGGALKLEKGNYHISEVLDSISGRLASLTEHHQLEVTVPAELPPVFVDEMRIGQVLANLVENATKFSSEGSQITIEAQLAGDQINVSVADRGQGIAPELLDRVFDRFYQAESIVTGRKSGTGLGLSICRGIVETHGGKIWVESKPGEGSKFSFSLPVGKEGEEVAQDSGY